MLSLLDHIGNQIVAAVVRQERMGIGDPRDCLAGVRKRANFLKDGIRRVISLLTSLAAGLDMLDLAFGNEGQWKNYEHVAVRNRTVPLPRACVPAMGSCEARPKRATANRKGVPPNRRPLRLVGPVIDS
jgi:hypothetical protein